MFVYKLQVFIQSLMHLQRLNFEAFALLHASLFICTLVNMH